MTDAAREARNAYLREWYRKNPEKAKARRERYWEKKAQQLRDETAVDNTNTENNG